MFFSLTSLTLSAQEIYGTTNGTIHISANVEDTVLIAVSKNLGVILNYDNASFKLNLDKSSLKTGNSYLDSLLETHKYDPIKFEGQMGIEHIKTEKHPPQDFEVNGYITCSPHYLSVSGRGYLEHIFGDYYSCILNMTLFLNPEEINLTEVLPKLKGQIKIEIIQSVLKRQD